MADNLADCPAVSLTYFVPNERKSGGDYVTVTGGMKKVDKFGRVTELD